MSHKGKIAVVNTSVPGEPLEQVEMVWQKSRKRYHILSDIRARPGLGGFLRPSCRARMMPVSVKT